MRSTRFRSEATPRIRRRVRPPRTTTQPYALQLFLYRTLLDARVGSHFSRTRHRRDANTIVKHGMEHLDTFLAHYPPFDALDPEMRGALAADAVQRSYRAGETVLVEDGLPALGLWVLLTGSMELLHEAEAIQVLGPGECFGHPSLLSGMAPAFTVRAREQSTCALFSAEAGRRVLATEAGVAYVAKTMRKRLVGTGDTVHGLLDVGTTPVSAIMRAPVFSEPEQPVRQAAGRLGRDGVSALLVRLEEDRLGIVTDADVRGMVGVDRLPLDARSEELARAPVPRVPIDQLAVEAIVDMVAGGTDHMV